MNTRSGHYAWPTENRYMRFWDVSLAQALFEFDEWANWTGSLEPHVIAYKADRMHHLLRVISYCRKRFWQATFKQERQPGGLLEGVPERR